MIKHKKIKRKPTMKKRIKKLMEKAWNSGFRTGRHSSAAMENPFET